MDKANDGPVIRGKIRVSDDGGIAIYDVMAAIGISQPRVYFKNLKSTHEEVVKGIWKYKFAGKGQTATPVTDFGQLKKIVCLLPNTTHDCAERLKDVSDLHGLVALYRHIDSKKRLICHEKKIQAELACVLKGKREVRCSHGIIDIIVHDDKLLVEVKKLSSWVHAVGQLLVYGKDYPDYRLRLHLFVTPKSPSLSAEKLFSIQDVCNSLGIEVTLDDSVQTRLVTPRKNTDA